MPTGGTPLLLTKLDVPPPRAYTLARERLLGLAPIVPGLRLVLLSAPAGFGKTTLLATWCHTLATQQRAALAWLSLDESDNDPARFLAYLVAAVARALPAPAFAQSCIEESAESIRAATESILTRLLNILTTCDQNVVLILDDYHVISAPAVHAAVAFLLDHLPPHVCMAIGSRADPPLPLARLRAREQLLELRAADLRFTADEIRSFFQIAHNLALAKEEVHTIMRYVEGWPAGVQLVALALSAEPRGWATEAGAVSPVCDPLAGLQASEHNVFAYLAEEVFERLPAHLKAFLLRTAILDRMSGPLCDAVLGLEARDLRLADTASSLKPQVSSLDSYSRLILEELERANLFVTAIDADRCWYRYHHLFRAFLCARLDRESRIVVADLHRRACAWYTDNDLQLSAVEHALAAGELTHAADLIEEQAVSVVARGEYATLHRWLERIPEAALQARPMLCLWMAWAALLAGEVERIAPPLQRAERAWHASGDRHKLGELAHLQAHLARLRCDGALAIAAARQALADLPEDQPTLRAGSILALAGGQLLAGDLNTASASIAEAYECCETHNFLGMLVALVLQGDLAALRGRLHQAVASYQEVLQLVGTRAIWERWEAALRLGDVMRERNQLDRAHDILGAALTAAEEASVAVYMPAGYVALARTRMAQGDAEGAAGMLEQGLRAAYRLSSPACERLVCAEQARLALLQGDIAAALRWQAALPPHTECDRSPAGMAEAMIQVRVLIAQARIASLREALHAARALLDWLRTVAEADGRAGSLIEVYALLALVEAGDGRNDRALAELCRALALAAPEGYARIFLDEGSPMAGLLGQIASARSEAAPYAMTLLAAFPSSEFGVLPQPLTHNSKPWPEPGRRLITQNFMVESLSDRELEVLRLIAGGASNQAIAAALVISIGTVKSHINHILGKLATGNRTEAVARARELGLLSI